jgi:CcmD family protein
VSTVGYLLAAYVFLWAMVFGYVFAIARKQRDLDRDIKILREALEREEIEG